MLLQYGRILPSNQLGHITFSRPITNGLIVIDSQRENFHCISIVYLVKAQQYINLPRQMKTGQLVYIISQMGHFTQKLVSLEWPGYVIVLCQLNQRVDTHWSVLGCRVQNVRTQACKLETVMYTRKPADNHFRCVVRVSIFSDWGNLAAGGCFCRSDRSPLYVLIRESLLREIG